MTGAEFEAWVVLMLGVVAGLFLLRGLRGRWGLAIGIAISACLPLRSYAQVTNVQGPVIQLSCMGSGTIFNPEAVTDPNNWYYPIHGRPSDYNFPTVDLNGSTTPAMVRTIVPLVPIAFKSGTDLYYLATFEVFEGGLASGTRHKWTFMVYAATKRIHAFISLDDSAWEELGEGGPVSGSQTGLSFSQAPSGGYHEAFGEPAAATNIYPGGLVVGNLQFYGGEVPSAPSALTVESGADSGEPPVHTDTATWTHTGANVDEYQAEWAEEANGPWTTLAPVAAYDRDATLSDIPEGATRWFRVRAGNTEGWSSWCGPARTGESASTTQPTTQAVEPSTQPMPWLSQGNDFLNGESGVFDRVRDLAPAVGGDFGDAFTAFYNFLSDDDISTDPAQDIYLAVWQFNDQVLAVDSAGPGMQGVAQDLWNKLIAGQDGNGLITKAINSIESLRSTNGYNGIKLKPILDFIKLAVSVLLCWTVMLRCVDWGAWSFGVNATKFLSYFELAGAAGLAGGHHEADADAADFDGPDDMNEYTSISTAQATAQAYEAQLDDEPDDLSGLS